MGNLIIAYDLGTGGNKASLYDLQGNCLAENFVTYQTFYPRAGWHEQRPADWWAAVVESTRLLLKAANVKADEIAALGISGHSLGVVPMDAHGTLLRESTPIWSDARPVAQTRQMFERISEAEWYRLTGNGFPAPLYSVFKIMWYRDNEPEMFKRIHAVIGTKDYVNYRLTGRMATDYSYASGSGVYDLVGWKYSPELIAGLGPAAQHLPRDPALSRGDRHPDRRGRAGARAHDPGQGRGRRRGQLLHGPRSTQHRGRPHLQLAGLVVLDRGDNQGPYPG